MFPVSAHEAGLVCLQVLESGGSISSSVLFEYRARNASSLPSSQLDWLSLDGQCQGSNFLSVDVLRAQRERFEAVQSLSLSSVVDAVSHLYRYYPGLKCSPE